MSLRHREKAAAGPFHAVHEVQEKNKFNLVFIIFASAKSLSMPLDDARRARQRVDDTAGHFLLLIGFNTDFVHLVRKHGCATFPSFFGGKQLWENQFNKIFNQNFAFVVNVN